MAAFNREKEDELRKEELKEEMFAAKAAGGSDESEGAEEPENSEEPEESEEPSLFENSGSSVQPEETNIDEGEMPEGDPDLNEDGAPWDDDEEGELTSLEDESTEADVTDLPAVMDGSGESTEVGGSGGGTVAPGKKKRRGKGKRGRRIVIILLILLIIVAAVYYFMARRRSSAVAAVGDANTAVVMRMDITASLSSSGTLSPKDTYSITSLASGEVLEADFEEGDQVVKDQVLYVIDSSSMETELHSAENSLERAETNYELAVEDYNDAIAKFGDYTYKSTESGYIRTLYVKAGDRVSSNTVLADIYNDSVMKLKVPFLSFEAAAIGVGNQGVITLSNTGEQLVGTVTSVANMEETTSSGQLVRTVTLEVNNPGGLTDSMYASVQIGDFLCAAEGTFEPSIDSVMSAVDLTSSVEIESVLVNEGDYVNKGSSIFRMTTKTGDSLIRTYKDSMDNAESNLESAESKLESTQDNYDEYTITAPISGTVITKDVKVGDKVNASSNNTSTLATIYDLSELTFTMSVDELDVQNVEVGQRVVVTADAFEDETFSGVVTNISLASSYSSGVTNYPVTVTLDEVWDLLPGMNVDGVIIIDEEEDALVIPVNALMRGNQVYVHDDSVTESRGNIPAGFRPVQVETGLTNDDFVQILSGLEEGDEVYVSDSSVSSSFTFPGMGGGMGGGMPGGGMPGGGGGMGGGNRSGGGGGMPGGGMR